MTYRRSLTRTALFAAAFAIATVAGRLTGRLWYEARSGSSRISYQSR